MLAEFQSGNLAGRTTIRTQTLTGCLKQNGSSSYRFTRCGLDSSGSEHKPVASLGTSSHHHSVFCLTTGSKPPPKWFLYNCPQDILFGPFLWLFSIRSSVSCSSSCLLQVKVVSESIFMLLFKQKQKFTAWTEYADTHSSLTVCVGLCSACMALCLVTSGLVQRSAALHV